MRSSMSSAFLISKGTELIQIRDRLVSSQALQCIEKEFGN